MSRCKPIFCTIATKKISFSNWAGLFKCAEIFCLNLNGKRLCMKYVIEEKQGIEYPKPSNKREIILKKVKKEDVVYDN